MKITYDGGGGGHVLQLKPKEVKSIITSIRALELSIKKFDTDSQLPEGMRPYRVICGDNPMRVLAEMEQLYDMM